MSSDDLINVRRSENVEEVSSDPEKARAQQKMLEENALSLEQQRRPAVEKEDEEASENDETL